MEEKNSMYDKLLLLPLFQGLCKDDFTNILEKVKLYFKSYPAGSYIIRQDDPCENLTFVLQGTVRTESADKTHNYVFYETLEGPYVIEPYSLFGMYPQYTASYHAVTKTYIVTIDKAYVLKELNKYAIFQLNYLNMLSNRVQSVYRCLWNSRIGSTQNKIINFLRLRCTTPGKSKRLHIRMEDLAGLIDDTRINVSKALNDLKQQGLVSLSRKEIEIPDMEALLSMTNK